MLLGFAQSQNFRSVGEVFGFAARARCFSAFTRVCAASSCQVAPGAPLENSSVKQPLESFVQRLVRRSEPESTPTLARPFSGFAALQAAHRASSSLLKLAMKGATRERPWIIPPVTSTAGEEEGQRETENESKARF